MGLFIASIVLMIVGLSKMVKYSKRFDIARKFYIAELILAVAGAIVLGILIAVTFVSLQSYTAQASTVTVLFVLFFVVFFGWLVAMVIIALKSMKYLLHGCAELADAVKERELAGKLRGIYILYLISVLVFFGVVILFMILVISSISTNLSLTCDLYSTTCLLLGKEKAIEFMKDKKGFEYCIVDNNQKITKSPGFNLNQQSE